MVHIKKVVAIHERVKKDTMNFEDMYYELSEGEICLDEVKEATCALFWISSAADASY